MAGDWDEHELRAEVQRLKALLKESRDSLSMLLGAAAAGMRAVGGDEGRMDRLCDYYEAHGITKGFGVAAQELVKRIRKEFGA